MTKKINIGKSKMKKMPSKGYIYNKKVNSLDRNPVSSKEDVTNKNIKSSTAKKIDKSYKRASKVNLGQNSMSTGNTYFDIGYSIGVSSKNKKFKTKKSKK